MRYDTATGARRVLVSAREPATRAPARQAARRSTTTTWSKDGAKLLLFTNTKKVWRRNTRGDYWVLDLASGKLHKLGGDAPESSR